MKKNVEYEVTRSLEFLSLKKNSKMSTIPTTTTAGSEGAVDAVSGDSFLAVRTRVVTEYQPCA